MQPECLVAVTVRSLVDKLSDYKNFAIELLTLYFVATERGFRCPCKLWGFHTFFFNCQILIKVCIIEA